MTIRPPPAISIFLVIGTLAGSVQAQTGRGSPSAGLGAPTASAAPIEITADELQIQQDRRLATFVGRVDAQQGDWRLRSDRVRVHYSDGSGRGERQSISRIEAEGRVQIRSTDQEADGDRADYDVDAGTLVMHGNVVLASRGNAVRGQQLVSDRNSGVSTLGGGRVQGRFLPTGGPSAGSRPAPRPSAAAPQEPILIAANALEVRQNQETALFYGSVDAEQGELRLRSDNLRIRYAATPQGSQQSVSRIDADGNVQVTTSSETATGDNGVYDVARGSVVLTGDVVLTRQGNVIRGRRLTVDLVSGESLFDAQTGTAGGGRVRGLFTPGRTGQ
jgi:lipopolysaccharide export system protein LptA